MASQTKKKDDLLTVEVLKNGVTVANATREKGDKVTCPRSEANIKSENGLVKILPNADNAAEERDKDQESDKTTAKNDNRLKNWAKGSNYLGADDVEKGDIITIIGDAEWEESDYEDDERPVIKVEHKQQQAKLSLNKQNTHNIAEEHGWNTEEWVGEQLKVVSKPYHKGIDSHSMLLEPM